MGLFTKSIRRNSNSPEDENSDMPGWLKMLQDNSWELEILISGGAIFSLFQLSGFITNSFIHLAYTSTLDGQSTLYIFAMLAAKCLTLGFSIHILLRSFWVGVVALSSMFKENENKISIKQAKPFQNIESVNLEKFVVTIDKLSAWMMYNTINLVFVLIGWMILFMSIITIGELVPDTSSNNLELILMIAFMVYLIDFLSFSILRKIPYLSYIVYPIFKLFDFISLRFIYQPGINYIDQHVAKWKTGLFYLLFITSSCVFTYVSIYSRMHWPNVFDGREYRFKLSENETYYTENYYRNLSSEPSRRARIQSDIITEPVVNLFINYSVVYDDYISQIPDENKRYFQNIFTLSVDDSLYTNQTYYTNNINHGIEGGVTTYLDVSSFKNGMHEIIITNKYETDSSRNQIRIPFALAVVK